MNEEERDCFISLLKAAPAGPRIEFGVFRGDTLKLMLHEGRTIGVDSFAGMPMPTDKDIKDGWNPYPEGRLAAGMQPIGNAELIRGFVPDVLIKVPDINYAFAHIDMDQYHSTLAALEWLWPRMIEGGIICCDDYFVDRDWLAAGAINEFAKRQPITGMVGRKAWFKC